MTSKHPSLAPINSELQELLSSEKFSFIGSPSLIGQDQDLAVQFQEALDHPLDYPALNATVFPGDRVAITLQTGLPRPLELLQLLLQQLTSAGVEANDVTVVINPALAAELEFSPAEIESATDSVASDPKMIAKSINGIDIAFQIHNSHNPTCVSYLAANEAGDPIYVSRPLVDADVILPVGFPLLNDRTRPHDSLYPEFSSSSIQERFEKGESTRRAQADEIQLANDTLGSFFSIQIVNGPGGEITRILTGSRALVMKKARREAEKIWEYHGPTDCEMTVATIETTIGKATWEDFLQAVITASRISVDASPIIVWSELDSRPPRSIRSALLSQFEAGSDKKLPRSIQQLQGILEEHPIYLHSKLSRNEVEALGLGFVDSIAAVNRIAEKHSQGFVLRDAHKYRIDPESPATK